MKASKLLYGKSSAYIASGSFKGHDVKIRIVPSKNRNTSSTWKAEFKVFAKGEKWMAIHWFNYTDTIDEILEIVSQKISVKLTKEIKVFERLGKRKPKVAKKKYYIKTAGNVGSPTTIETNAPLFEVV